MQIQTKFSFILLSDFQKEKEEEEERRRKREEEEKERQKKKLFTSETSGGYSFGYGSIFSLSNLQMH